MYLYDIGYVYFVEAPEVDRIKIGWSASVPTGRLTDLKVGSPVELELLGFVVSYKQHERRMHRRFAKSRSHGEWFYETPQLRRYINRYATRPEDVVHLGSELDVMVRAKLADHVATRKLRAERLRDAALDQVNDMAVAISAEKDKETRRVMKLNQSMVASKYEWFSGFATMCGRPD